LDGLFYFHTPKEVFDMSGNENTQYASRHLPAEVLAETASLTDIEVAKLETDAR